MRTPASTRPWNPVISIVVFEPDIGQNLARLGPQWGEDYNRNRLTAIRALVFCNARLANQLGNQDPTLLALCPMHITLIERDGKTIALFTRPTVLGADSPALPTAREIEDGVIAAIEDALDD